MNKLSFVCPRLEEIRRSAVAAAAVKRPYDSTRSSSSRYDEGWDAKRPTPSDR